MRYIIFWPVLKLTNPAPPPACKWNGMGVQSVRWGLPRHTDLHERKTVWGLLLGSSMGLHFLFWCCNVLCSQFRNISRRLINSGEQSNPSSGLINLPPPLPRVLWINKSLPFGAAMLVARASEPQGGPKAGRGPTEGGLLIRTYRGVYNCVEKPVVRVPSHGKVLLWMCKQILTESCFI